MNEQDREYTEQLFTEALKVASGGFSLEAASAIGEKGIALIQRELEKAEAVEDTKPVKCPACKASMSIPVNMVDRSKALVNLGTMLDKLVRLGAFTSGKPDSRPEQQLAMKADVLQGLKTWQFNQVCEWLAENEREVQDVEA